ncbi:hypothetical protein BDA96_10G264400 [Sorghum bicolor]|uniref:Uncharacterized protein n=2 Tax=Sorghum bicolor TaxID=4558 RepID=A0A921U242_SORBI|nr:hypothetical protein BDA96_10G264400 [Sorghum bicolor]KXG20470.2 hypothetical protein SORBI_3010G203150 [Sorghum bicolor]
MAEVLSVHGCWVPEPPAQAVVRFTTPRASSLSLLYLRCDDWVAYRLPPRRRRATAGAEASSVSSTATSNRQVLFKMSIADTPFPTILETQACRPIRLLWQMDRELVVEINHGRAGGRCPLSSV